MPTRLDGERPGPNRSSMVHTHTHTHTHRQSGISTDITVNAPLDTQFIYSANNGLKVCLKTNTTLKEIVQLPG